MFKKYLIKDEELFLENINNYNERITEFSSVINKMKTLTKEDYQKILKDMEENKQFYLNYFYNEYSKGSKKIDILELIMVLIATSGLLFAFLPIWSMGLLFLELYIYYYLIPKTKSNKKYRETCLDIKQSLCLLNEEEKEVYNSKEDIIYPIGLEKKLVRTLKKHSNRE